jgi:PAS domain-containing protein
MTSSPSTSSATPAALADLEQGMEQLKVANYYLRVALDQVADGVVIVESEASDPKSGPKVLFSNAAAAMLAGADPEAGLRGLGLNDLVAGDRDATTLLKSLRLAVENGGCHECECQFAKPAHPGAGALQVARESCLQQHAQAAELHDPHQPRPGGRQQRQSGNKACSG